MSRQFNKQFASGPPALKDPVLGATFDWGTSIPTDGTAGFATGCVFVLVNGTAGYNVYTNIGSQTSCQFVAMAINPLISSITSATQTLTAADSGKVFTLNRAAGIAVTLPTPVAGMWFRFVIQTTFTGAASIKSASGAHIMIGHAIMGNDTDNNTVMWQALAANTFDTIDMFGTANSTGGIAGQTIDIKALSSTVWIVEIQGDAAGTEATPFQDTVA